MLPHGAPARNRTPREVLRRDCLFLTKSMLDGFTGPGRAIRYFTSAATLMGSTRPPSISECAQEDSNPRQVVKSHLLNQLSYERMVGAEGFEPPMYLTSWFYRPLASPFA